MKSASNDFLSVSYDIIKPQHQKRKRVIKKLINKVAYSSFFVGVLFALGVGALFQKIYNVSSDVSLIHKAFQIFWFGPTTLTWMGIVICSIVFLVMIRNKFSEKISGVLKVRK